MNVKQYCKGKPNPFSIKIFMLCGQNGMIYDFILYQGAETEFYPRIKNIFGLGGAVVLQLTENIKENKHFLIIISLVIIYLKFYTREKYSLFQL